MHGPFHDNLYIPKREHALNVRYSTLLHNVDILNSQYECSDWHHKPLLPLLLAGRRVAFRIELLHIYS
jgi:hypothetical protein